MVVTIEPGFYQIPQLLEQAYQAVPHLIDWDTLTKFNDVRGIRIEDDVLIASEQAEVLSEISSVGNKLGLQPGYGEESHRKEQTFIEKPVNNGMSRIHQPCRAARDVVPMIRRLFVLTFILFVGCVEPFPDLENVSLLKTRLYNLNREIVQTT